MKSKAGGFLIFFGVFWSALTLVFDGLVVVPAVEQLLAMNFGRVEGTILSSEVTHSSDSEGGSTHGVSMRYSYVVEDREYVGTRYRYGKFSSSDSAWAHSAVNARPPGTKVDVFYSPSDPQDSVLTTGISGSDLFMVAFMTPFNAVMLSFWWAGLAWLRRKWFKPEAGGVKIRRNLRTTRIRLCDFGPLGTTMAAITILSFISIFPVAFLGGGFHPSMRTMIIVWSIILGGGLLGGGWHAIQIFSGKYDLVLDELGSSLELPLTQGRTTRRRVSLGDVKKVRVEVILKPSSGDEGPSESYAPTIEIDGPTPHSERLADFYDEDKAEAFVDWLREKLRR